jgi:hypothetical protein
VPPLILGISFSDGNLTEKIQEMVPDGTNGYQHRLCGKIKEEVWGLLLAPSCPTKERIQFLIEKKDD